MASFEQLTEAVERALNKQGVSKRLKAELFAAVAAILDEDDETPDPPQENIMINSLVHEYLEFNGMVGTSRMLALESGLHSEQRLAREFMAYTLGLDGELAAQTQADIPLLYGTVAQVSAARQAAISAGLAAHTAQPPALMHPAAAQEAHQLGDAIARAYKTDALRDVQQQHQLQQQQQRRQQTRAGDAAASHTHSSRGQAQQPTHANVDARAQWLHEHSAAAGIGAGGRVGQAVVAAEAGGAVAAAEGGQQSRTGSEESYDDDDFTDESAL